MQIPSAYIVSSVRTAVGKAKRGTLRNVRPEYLGATAVQGALARVPTLTSEAVDDVIIGCAYPEGAQGHNMGRVVAQKAGLPDSVSGATINRFCSSGLQTIAMGAMQVMTGQSDVVVAGGVESMSSVPMGGFYFAPDADLAAADPDVYVDMGNTAENVATQYDINRADQDAFSLRSHQRAMAAIDEGRFTDEIIPMPVEEVIYQNGGTKTVETTFSVDEGVRRDTTLEALSKLRPVFRNPGTVTAGNASQVSDGAAATVLMSAEKVAALDVQPMARFVGFATAGVAPEIMGIGPIEAIPKVLKRTGLSLDDIGLIELNEAFASQALAVVRTLGLNEDIVNVNGGAIALGHPLGCTGAKLTATLLHEMQRRGVKYGLCTMCIGGGMGAAGIFENLMA